MNQNDGKAIIFLYNLYMLFVFPLAIFMCCFWVFESKSPNCYEYGVVTPIEAIFIFLPELVFGLKWDLNGNFGGRIFTILGSVVVGWILNKQFYSYFMVQTDAPITYYTEKTILVTGIIWTVIIEFDQNLRNHLLLYPPEEFMAPRSEDETENSYWNGYSRMLFWAMFVLLLLVIFRII